MKRIAPGSLVLALLVSACSSTPGSTPYVTQLPSASQPTTPSEPEASRASPASPQSPQPSEPVASGTPPGSAPPVVPPPEGFLPPGSVVRATADSVRMRSDPSTSADVVTTVAAGQLLGLGPGSREGFGPVEADGHAWYPAALLPDAQLPPLLIGPLGFTARGWVAGDFLELVEPRCVAGDPDLRILSTQTPWERYACIGNRSITFDGTFGCGGCGGARSGTFEPAWLAFPMDLGFISVDPNERIGPMTLRFPDGGAEVPDSGSVLRVTGHYGDPAAEQCVYQPVDEPIPASTDAVQLYCEIQFVVESYEITGIDTDFPSG